MRASNSFKRLFLKKFLLGLQQGDLSSRNMSLLERKNAIKLSSDVALASARGEANWSLALIANISKQEKNKILIQKILGNKFKHLTKPCNKSLMCRKVKSKHILRRSCAMNRIRKCKRQRILPSSLAKKMVNKRTQILRSIIPGAVSMDGFTLLDEAIDYISALNAQIDVMRHLAYAFEQ